MLTVLDATALRRWAVLARSALAARRAEIDDLNVYPVPDGDTGTNLYLTLDGALDVVRSRQEELGVLGRASLVDESQRLARAMLVTARGNSGVILSQLVHGFAESVAGSVDHQSPEPTAVAASRESRLESGRELGAGSGIGARELAAALAAGAHQARQSVAHPVEGTILTVSEAAAGAAQGAADAGADLSEVVSTAVEAARDALAATTGQLPELAAAGVVDAGGAGFLLLLESLARVTGENPADPRYALDEFTYNPSLRRRPGWRTSVGTATDAVDDAVVGGQRAPGGAAAAAAAAGGGLSAHAGGPAYEVMFLLDETTTDSVTALRDALDELGDSLIVVGGPVLWNVHVHVDDAGAALEAAVAAGRPHRIRVTHFGDVSPRVDDAEVASLHRSMMPESGVVACSAGPGIARIFQEAGATTVPSGPGARASTGQLLEAITATGARTVLLLPNDRDTTMAARAAASAAREEGLVVHVVGSKTAVQGLAALAVYDPMRSAAENVVAMTAASAATRHGGLTIAVKDGLTSGGPCRLGDVLGIVGGDIVIVGSDQLDVAEQVVANLVASGGELVTLLVGADLDPHLVDALVDRVHRLRRDLEVSVVDGGQPHYPLLIGVE